MASSFYPPVSYLVSRILIISRRRLLLNFSRPTFISSSLIPPSPTDLLLLSYSKGASSPIVGGGSSSSFTTTTFQLPYYCLSGFSHYYLGTFWFAAHSFCEMCWVSDRACYVSSEAILVPHSISSWRLFSSGWFEFAIFALASIVQHFDG